jgi:probable phosphoglycerate mutase
VSAADGRPTAAVAGGSIWLVRHAHTDWTGRRWCGRSDPELTGFGRAAAGRVAGEIAAGLVTDGAVEVVVLTSPLRRAVRTAEAIAAALGAPVHVERDLVEVDFGAADGLTWGELVTAHPSLAEAILAGRDPDWPGGETAGEVADRAQSTAARLLDLATTGAVVAVSHGGLLRAVAPLLGTDPLPRDLDPATALRLDPAPAR